jgi:hypothetical protein
MKIIMNGYAGTFAENKDIAREVRERFIKPQLAKNREEKIVLDFKDVDSSTQSFIHALLSGFFQRYKEEALDFFEFKNCNKAIKSLITTVINYSLE